MNAAGTRRLFARGLVRFISALGLRMAAGEDGGAAVVDLDRHEPRNESEAALQEALLSIESAMVALGPSAEEFRDNHIFLNFLLTSEVSMPDEFLRSLFRRYESVVSRCRVTCVEVRLTVSINASTSQVVRFVLTDPTGHILVIDRYVEETGPDGIVRYKGERGALCGLPVSTPYSLRTRVDERRRAAHRLQTQFVYDFLDLFREAVDRFSHQALPVIGASGPSFSSIELVATEEDCRQPAAPHDFPDGHSQETLGAEGILHGCCCGFSITHPVLQVSVPFTARQDKTR